MPNCRIILCYICIFILSLCWGCTRTFNVKIDRIGNLPDPLIERLPIKVGVYYSDDFRKFKATTRKEIHSNTFIYNIHLGEVNIALFDYILSNTFKKVTFIDVPEKISENPGIIDLFLVPEIDTFTYQFFLTKDNFIREKGVNIIYNVELFSSAGEKISDWRINGRAKGRPYNSFMYRNEETFVAELIQMAMHSVALQINTGFCYQKEMREIFYDQCNR